MKKLKRIRKGLTKDVKGKRCLWKGRFKKVGKILKKLFRKVRSIRCFLTVFFLISIFVYSSIFLTIATVFSTYEIQHKSDSKIKLVGKFVAQFQETWLGQGKRIVGSMLDFLKLQDFLEEVSSIIGNEGTMVLVDKRSGELLATSAHAKISVKLGGDDDLTQENIRIKPEESEVNEVRYVSKWMKKKYKKWNLVTNSNKTMTISTPGGRRIITFESLNITGLETLFIYSIKFERVYSTLITFLYVSIPSGIVIIFAISIFFIFATMLVTRPLFKLAKEIEKIETMDLDGISFKNSMLYEVNILHQKFNFTIQKLKEYRSFLPENLLKSQNSPGSENEDCNTTVKSPGRKRRMSVFSLPMKENNNNEDSGEEDMGSLGSIGSSYSPPSSPRSSDGTRFPPKPCKMKSPRQGSISRQYFGRGRFQIHLEEIFFTVCGVYFSFDHNEIRRRVRGMLALSNQIFHNIRRFSKRRHGDIYKSDFDGFLVAFRDPKSACIFSLDAMEYLMPNTCLKKFGTFRVMLHRGMFFQGNIGSSNVKKRVIWGEDMEVLKEIKKSLDPLLPNHVVMTNDVEKCLDEEFIRVPYNVIKSSITGRTYPIYSLWSRAEFQQDEWMYELAQKSHRSRFDPLLKGFSYVVKNKIEKAVELLEEYVEQNNNDEGTKLLEFVRKMVEMKICFSDLVNRKEIDETENKCLLYREFSLGRLSRIVKRENKVEKKREEKVSKLNKRGQSN